MNPIKKILGKNVDVSKNREEHNGLVWSPKTRKYVRYIRNSYKKSKGWKCTKCDQYNPSHVDKCMNCGKYNEG